MSRAWSALAGGVAGTAALSVLLLFLEVETWSALGIFGAIARFTRVPNDVAVGVAIFVAAGVVAWPLVFVAAEGLLPFGDVATRGMAFGVVLCIGGIGTFVVGGVTGVFLGRHRSTCSSTAPITSSATST